VRRIDYEPRPRRLADLVNVAKLHGSRNRAGRITREKRCTLDSRLLPLLNQSLELLPLDILDPPTLEFRRPLERRALLVLVGEVSLQVWIAPRRLWWNVSFRGSGLGWRLGGCLRPSRNRGHQHRHQYDTDTA